MAERLTHIPFWFLRHGETDWNARGLTQGSTEIPLNANGIAQAEAVAALLQDHTIRSLIVSPVGRARQTAEIIAHAIGVAFTTDRDLREASFGDQEGQPMGGWYDQWVAGTYTPKNGESFAAICDRATPAINRALLQPGPVLVVAHGGMFRAVRHAMGLAATVRTANGVPLFCRPGSPAWSLDPASK